MAKTLKQRPLVALALGVLVLYTVAAILIVQQIEIEWLRLLHVGQLVAVAIVGAMLIHQVNALKRAQPSLLVANADLRGAQVSLQTANNALRTSQAALRRSEQRFRLMFDSMRGIIVCMGTKGADAYGYDSTGVVLFGADVERIAGTTAETGTKQLDRWYSVVHPDDRGAYVAAERRRKDEGEPYTLTYRFIHPDSGELRWASETAWRVTDAESGQIHFDGYILDITEQKHLEAALRQSEAEVRRARQQLIDGIEALTDGFALYDADDRLAVCNSRYRERFALDPEMMRPGARFEDILRARIQAGRIPEAVGREEEWIGERMARHRDPRGVFEHFMDSHWYRYNEQRTSEGGTVGIFTEIDEQKQRERKLAESRVILQSVIDNIPVTVSITDRDRRVVLLNKTIEALYGVRLNEVVGRNVDELRPARYRGDTAVSDHYRVLETGQPVVGHEDRYNGERGEEAWITNVVPIKDDRGAVKYVLRTTMEIPQLARANRALADSRTLLIEAERQAKICSWYWQVGGEAGKVWSETGPEILGVPIERIISDADYLALVHPEDRDAVVQAYIAAMKGVESYAIEYRFCQPGGKTIWLRELAKAQNDGAGRPYRLIGTVQDVTDQKRVEEALRESEARLRAFFDHAPFSMYLKDTELRYLLVNREVERFQGMTAREICGRTADQLYAPELAARFLAEDRAVLARGEPIAFEHSDPSLSSYRDSLTVRFPIRDDAGRIVAIGGITQDVSESKHAERALRESAARLRAFMDHAPVGMLVKDLDGRVVMTNRLAAGYFGRAPEEVIGLRTTEFLSAESAALVMAHEQAVLASGVPQAREMHFPEQPNLEWSYDVKFPIRDPGGDIMALGAILMDISDRKRAEAARQETELLFRSFLENSPAGMAVKDRDGRFLLVNRHVEAEFGRPAKDILGRRSAEIAPPEDAAVAEAMDREALKSGQAVAREVHLPARRDFSWTYMVKFPITDAGGRITAIGGFGFDIGERKRAELALRESEARLRAFMANSPVGMTIKDLDGRFVMVNREVELAFARPAAELIGHRMLDLVASDGARTIDAMDRQVLETGMAVAGEVSGLDRPGPRWTYEVKFPIDDDAGRMIAIGGISVDLTELKKTERALRKSEARLRQAQQQARLAYWNWRFDAEEYQWAPGSGLILGLPDEALPKAEADYYATIHPDDRERMSRLYDDVKAGLEHYTAEFRILRPDGTVRWMREIGEVEHDAGGRRISVAGTIQDITGQRAIEEQLQQAQKMEAVGQLTGGIAHDFNNLLAIILGNLELLRAALSQDLEARERIDTAIRATLRGSDLTHRLLAFARQQPLAPKATQIDDLIRSMRDLLLRPLGPTIDVEFAMGEDLWPTQIDQAQLETSLLNLVINARDAMPDGGKLTVATANIAVGLEEANQIEGLVPGDYVVISVSDTGGGMTDEVRTRAFDPFFTTKGVGKGTGLGLSMVYGFVKQSGGHIELHSAVGLGTTVKIWLPRAKGAAGPTAAGSEANEARGRETILIVEDEPGILALVADHLKGLGYSVVAALDGPAALAAIAEHREIDLLLTDIVLPGPLNGRAVAGQACAMRPKLKVVYMSGYAPNSAVPGGRLDPGVRHIVKPFRKVDLARMVREALDERDAG